MDFGSALTILAAMSGVVYRLAKISPCEQRSIPVALLSMTGTMAARLAPYLRYYSSNRPTHDHDVQPKVPSF